MTENQNIPPSDEGKRKTWTERIEVSVDQLASRIQELVAEGNVRSVKIRYEGRTVLDIPLTAAVVGGVAGVWLAPFFAALVAIAGIVARVEVLVEREGEPPKGPPPTKPPVTGPGEGV